MINFNPHDWARQNHEDPTNFMKNTLQVQKQKLILRHAALPADMRFSFESSEEKQKILDQLVHSDDDEDENEEGSQFIIIFYYFL